MARSKDDRKGTSGNEILNYSVHPNAHPFNAVLHQATEIGHLPGHPGQEGQKETHHLEGKGP